MRKGGIMFGKGWWEKNVWRASSAVDTLYIYILVMSKINMIETTWAKLNCMKIKTEQNKRFLKKKKWVEQNWTRCLPCLITNTWPEQNKPKNLRCDTSFTEQNYDK
jgi:hypothetical protein